MPMDIHNGHSLEPYNGNSWVYDIAMKPLGLRGNGNLHIPQWLITTLHIPKYYDIVMNGNGSSSIIGLHIPITIPQ